MGRVYATVGRQSVCPVAAAKQLDSPDAGNRAAVSTGPQHGAQQQMRAVPCLQPRDAAESRLGFYPLQIQIGNADYNCSCSILYTPSSELWLIVSVSCCVVLLTIVVIVVCVVIACRRRRAHKSPEEEERTARNDYVHGPADVFELDDRNYWTIPVDSADMPSRNSVYCSAGPAEPDDNKEYTALGKPRPRAPQPPPQSEPQPTSSNSPYYLSLKDDD